VHLPRELLVAIGDAYVDLVGRHDLVGLGV